MPNEEQEIRKIVPGLENLVCPLPGVVTAGQPTPQEFERLAEAGYKTVLDLRAPDEPRGYDEEAAVRGAEMEYINIPVTPATLSSQEFDDFRELMCDPDRRPIIVHCGSANRVGALLIPYLILDEDNEPEEAYRTAVEVGLRSQELADTAMAYTEEAGKD